ncbi:MAG: chromate efflux transporter [Xanthobacteraceae bacterium]
MDDPATPNAAAPNAGSLGEVFLVFLKLGLTSFGGPVAHLGYFNDELVVRRKWIDPAGYADLVALCQFLPGPASSQVGFALGLRRAGGIAGGIAAWLAFTLPSALILLAFALTAHGLDGPLAQAMLHGLKLVAVAVVAQAVWSMARGLAPDRPRAALALGAVLLVAFAGPTVGHAGGIALGALAGLVLCRGDDPVPRGHLRFAVSRPQGATALALSALLFVLPPLLGASPALQVFDAFYRSGALVFGGGHVVLPLLQSAVVAPSWVSEEAFLAGYGLAQAVPGPLFSFAAYLGAVLQPGPNGVAGAALALVAVFLPGLLLVVGVLPFWDGLRTRPAAQAAMRGANAAVVGILGSALYQPVWTGAVHGPGDFALALAGFLLLTMWRVPPVLVVAGLTVAAAVRLVPSFG